MYEKLKDSAETEEEKKIRYVNKRKTRTNRETGGKNQQNLKKLIVMDAEPQTGHDNTNVQ